MSKIVVVYEGLDSRNCESCEFFYATNTTEECEMEVLTDYTNINTTTISCSFFKTRIEAEPTGDKERLNKTLERVRIKR